jgi:hypothetical protein
VAAREVGSRRASLETERRALMAASHRMEKREKPYEPEGRMGLRKIRTIEFFNLLAMPA